MKRKCRKICRTFEDIFLIFILGRGGARGGPQSGGLYPAHRHQAPHHPVHNQHPPLPNIDSIPRDQRVPHSKFGSSYTVFSIPNCPWALIVVFESKRQQFCKIF